MSASPTSRTLLVGVLAIGALAGAGATWLALTPRGAAGPPSIAAKPPTPVRAAEGSVRLSTEDIARARITVARVEAATLGDAVTVPAMVEANTYKQTVVTSLLPGRVTRVLAELGQHVRRGQALAELYSPELADAQRAYISASAALQAHEQQLTRTDALVAIGSASRQELEMAHAEHAALTTSLEGARTRLALLGLTPEHVAGLLSASQITATTEVRAPLDGVVTVRQANVGANVDPAMPLFTVADLSTVWIVGDVFERDFSRVGVGRPVAVTIGAFSDLALRSTIDYIDPQLNRETRTARVRAEVPNRQDRLRLGMYAQMRIDTVEGRVAPVIPRAAVQTIGDRSIVYVVDPNTPGLFLERSIQTGVEEGDRLSVVSGVAVGDSIVSAGSFFLRAELERLDGSPEVPSQAAQLAQPVSGGRQTARVVVTDKGFEPERLALKPGVPATVTFVRTTDATCAKEVVFPSLNIRRELPLNTPVGIELTPSHADLGYVCGMGMFKGTIAAE